MQLGKQVRGQKGDVWLKWKGDQTNAGMAIQGDVVTIYWHQHTHAAAAELQIDFMKIGQPYGPPEDKPPLCIDGDVRASETSNLGENVPIYPEVHWKGRWYPICGHYFWDSDDGATTICRTLGFQKGTRVETRTVFLVDAMPVGRCKPGERMYECTGGGNAWGDV